MRCLPLVFCCKYCQYSTQSSNLDFLLQLMIVGSLTTDGNLWGSRSALNVILVYCGQLIWNLASRFITKNWGEDVAVNVIGLFVFAGVAGLMMCVQIRAHSQIWAEALQSSNVTDARVIRLVPTVCESAVVCFFYKRTPNASFD